MILYLQQHQYTVAKFLLTYLKRDKNCFMNYKKNDKLHSFGKVNEIVRQIKTKSDIMYFLKEENFLVSVFSGKYTFVRYW